MHGRKTHPSPAPAPAPALPAFITPQADGVLLAIKLQPRASKNEIGDPLNNELRVKVTAPPVDSAANEALLRLLAEVLDCPRSKLELIRGHTSRHKTVKVNGATTTTILAKLA
ncbi:MAG TPA: DUF167 domain-containing protein [Verrucomicrobiae bacterium]|nr:DUF167 domain-containing protein [Verrucomicrobiae bacterium]